MTCSGVSLRWSLDRNRMNNTPGIATGNTATAAYHRSGRLPRGIGRNYGRHRLLAQPPGVE